MDVQVIVTTWGHPSWAGLARKTAIPSAVDQAPVFHYHTVTPGAGAARNEAVSDCNPSEWIIFLDADDELAPGYVEAMKAAVEHDEQLLSPALQLPGQPARTLEDRDIVNGINPCPIGTMIHRRMFDEVGGFWNERAYEDWSLFRRAVLVGAEILFVPDAVYHAHSTPSGRNGTVPNARRLMRDIVRSHNQWMKMR